MIVLVIVLSVLSGYLYRLGGMNVNDRPKWLRWKPRDVGCMVCCMVGALALGIEAPALAWVLSGLFLFGALTTYWDWAFKNVDNYYAHGFVAGFAFFPLAIATGDWLGLIVRAVVLGIFMGIWCQIHTEVKWEEGGRGAALVLSLFLL